LLSIVAVKPELAFVAIDEALQSVAIPLTSVRSSMSLVPLKVEIDYAEQIASWANTALSGNCH